MKSLQFDVISEIDPGSKFIHLFDKNWAAYRAWYLDEGEEARPSYLECVSALKKYMPELLPLYHQLTELLDCDDLQARFLSLYCPPPFYSACSQLIYKKEQSVLIRNYDFPALLCEATILQSRWLDKSVIAMADCVWGVLDGINDEGLSLSINYGGRLIEGKGFAITIVTRYILQTCNTVEEAIAVFKRIPVHLDYNIALLDKAGHHATVFIAPDQEPHITQETTSTNHQSHVKDGKPLFLKDSATRLEALNWLTVNDNQLLSHTITQFLLPPLYRPHGNDKESGTLYTAVYNPIAGHASYIWQDNSVHLSFEQFQEQVLDIYYA